MIMLWKISHSCDPVARDIADRHYNRQKVGSRRFVPPGRCITLLSLDNTAVWATSFPYGRYVLHEWGGAFINSIFRNEGQTKSSKLIKDAVRCTIALMGLPDKFGFVTFVNSDPACVKQKKDYGFCYIVAGFRPCGFTKSGLHALMLRTSKLPEGAWPIGYEPTNYERVRLNRINRSIRIGLTMNRDGYVNKTNQ